MSSLVLDLIIKPSENLIRTDRHRLSGTILVNGMPAKKPVVCFRKVPFTLIGVNVSNANTGHWEIKGMTEYPMESVVVIVLESLESNYFNSKIYDFISQVHGTDYNP